MSILLFGYIIANQGSCRIYTRALSFFDVMLGGGKSKFNAPSNPFRIHSVDERQSQQGDLTRLGKEVSSYGPHHTPRSVGSVRFGSFGGSKKTTSQRHSLYYQGFDNLDSYSLQSGIYAGQMCPPCKCKPDLALTKYVLK
jgi:hypothetical protein